MEGILDNFPTRRFVISWSWWPILLILLGISVVRIQSDITFRQSFDNKAGKALKACWETWRIKEGQPCDNEARRKAELAALETNKTDAVEGDLMSIGLFALRLSIEKSCVTGANCTSGICRCPKKQAKGAPKCPPSVNPKPRPHCHAEMEAFLSPNSAPSSDDGLQHFYRIFLALITVTNTFATNF